MYLHYHNAFSSVALSPVRKEFDYVQIPTTVRSFGQQRQPRRKLIGSFPTRGLLWTCCVYLFAA